MGKPIIWSGSNAKLINSGDLVDRNDLSLTNGDKITVTQASHGFTSSDVGRPLYLNGTTWTLARADASNTAEVAGFIYSVLDSNTLKISTSGQCPAVGANFLDGGGSLTAGEVYFLSPTTAGKVTATEPTTIGYVSKPIGVATSTTAFQFFNFRGTVVGGANARTQLTLANNTTATIQNVSGYDAGELAGWIYIDATTDYRFYVQAQFVRGADNNYDVSYQTSGDTPPAGFSLSMTNAGLLQYTMPNLAGFSATNSVINYALNAPAVGTNFPLSIDGSAVVSGTVSASNLPVAGAAASGIINTSTQSLAGQKTFLADLNVGSAVGPLTTSTNRSYLTIRGRGTDTGGGAGVMQLISNSAGSISPLMGLIEWHIPDNTSSFSTRTAYIGAFAEGTGANNVGGQIRFATKTDNVSSDGTERMRITAAGNVGIGTSTPGSLLDVNGIVTVGGPGVRFTGATIAGLANAMGLRWSSPDIIGTVDNVVTAVLGTSSDYRLKSNVQDLPSCLDKILSLRPVTFTPLQLDGTPTDYEKSGFIAHEIQEFFPDLVTSEKDAVNAEGIPQFQSVHYAGLTSYLVKAIQELKAELDAVKTELNQLKG